MDDTLIFEISNYTSYVSLLIVSLIHSYANTFLPLSEDLVKSIEVLFCPALPFANVKGWVGMRINDAYLQSERKLWPFKVIYLYMIVVDYKGKEKLFAAEEISSMILIKVHGIPKAFLARGGVLLEGQCQVLI